jgi:hypothetical protein
VHPDYRCGHLSHPEERSQSGERPLGANSGLEGSILAGTSITFGTGSELRGCALAKAAVTFASNGSVELNDVHYEELNPRN